MESEPPAQVDAARDYERELEFLRERVRALARGRFPDEQQDVAADAWIRLNRALRREAAENPEALMASIAWRTWLDFSRKKARLRRGWGSSVPIDDLDLPSGDGAPSVDSEALALWRFAVCEWFAQHLPPCAESARQYFSSRTWSEAASELGERAEALAKRWQRCKDKFVDMVRADRGSLREILDHFERAIS